MNDLKEIKLILNNHLNINQNKVFIFGSRAQGSHRPDSDLDLLIDDSVFLEASIITRLHEAFEESQILYKVDIVLRSQISEEFYQKIKKDLTEIKY